MWLESKAPKELKVKNDVKPIAKELRTSSTVRNPKFNKTPCG